MTSESNQPEALLNSLSAPDIAHRIGEHLESKGKQVTRSAVNKWAAHWRAWKDFCERERVSPLPMTVPNVRQFLLEAIVSQMKGRTLATYLESFELFHRVAGTTVPWSELEGAELLKILAERHLSDPPATKMPSDVDCAAAKASEPGGHPQGGARASAAPYRSSGLAHAEQLLADTAAKKRTMEISVELPRQRASPIIEQAAAASKSPTAGSGDPKEPGFAEFLSGLHGSEGSERPDAFWGEADSNSEGTRVVPSPSGPTAASVAAFFEELLATAAKISKRKPNSDARELTARAQRDFLEGGAARMRMLRLAVEGLNEGDVRLVEHVLRGCVSGAGGINTVAKATTVPKRTLKQAFSRAKSISPDLARLLVLQLSRWPAP